MFIEGSYGKYFVATEEVRGGKSWEWLKYVV